MISYCLMSMCAAEINPCLDNLFTTMPKDISLEKNLNHGIDYAHKHIDKPWAAIARKCGVDRMTLNRRLNCIVLYLLPVLNPIEGLMDLHALEHMHEECSSYSALRRTKYCRLVHQNGWYRFAPCAVTMIKIMAGRMLYDRGVIVKPGIHCPQRFFQWNPAVESRSIHYLEQVRAKAATPEALRKWDHYLRSTMRRLNILPENI